MCCVPSTIPAPVPTFQKVIDLDLALICYVGDVCDAHDDLDYILDGVDVCDGHGNLVESADCGFPDKTRRDVPARRNLPLVI